MSGELAVGALYHVLDTCGGRLYEEACDVPLLLAPLPFAAASLQALQPEVCPRSHPTAHPVAFAEAGQGQPINARIGPRVMLRSTPCNSLRRPFLNDYHVYWPFCETTSCL